MIKKIKEKSFPYFFLKKRFFLFFLFVFSLLVIPFFFVDGLAATIAAYTANILTSVIFLAISTASLVFSTFADWFLRLTLSPNFINLPYTPGGDSVNEFVKYGWEIVRDFVNMFFIIVLIIIGLSTSLQIETYRWQKTLPRLVLVALLVNFTPVILGIFIDASNIIMNYFVNSVAEESIFIIRMRGLFDIVAQRLADTVWTSFTGAVITPVAMAVIFTLFNIFTGIIYGLYSIAFAMRYVAIWLLVIISPFGFFCYILPATQPFFRKWWRWFIGWCLMGIAAIFFLYMGEIMFNFIDQGSLMPDKTEHHGMEIGSFVVIFPLLVPLIFIFFGFFVALSLSSLGSKGIIEAFRVAGGEARKRSAQLPGSNFREKTKAFASATINTFSPGPAVGPTSSSSSGTHSFRQRTSGGSLYRRDRGAMTDGETSISSSNKGRSLSEFSSYANRGVGFATREIAENITAFEEQGKKPPFSLNFSDNLNIRREGSSYASEASGKSEDIGKENKGEGSHFKTENSSGINNKKTENPLSENKTESPSKGESKEKGNVPPSFKENSSSDK